MCRPSSSRRRHTQLETIRGKLRAARPLLTQLRAADEVRDKAIKRHGLLNKEIIGLRLILEGKALELAEAATEVKKATQCVAEVQSKLTAIDLMQLEAAPRPAEVSPELTPIQIAVQLATALDPFTRASFEAWMASVPAGAVPVYDMAAGDELMAGQAEQAAAAAAGAEAMTPQASRCLRSGQHSLHSVPQGCARTRTFGQSGEWRTSWMPKTTGDRDLVTPNPTTDRSFLRSDPAAVPIQVWGGRAGGLPTAP